MMNATAPSFAEFAKGFLKSPSGKFVIIPVLILLLGNILYYVLVDDNSEEITEKTKLKTFETKLPEAKVDAKTLENKAKIYNESNNTKTESTFSFRDSSLTNNFTELVAGKPTISNQTPIAKTDPYAQKPFEGNNGNLTQVRTPEEMYSRRQAARQDILNEYEFKNKVVQLQNENIRLNSERKNLGKNQSIGQTNSRSTYPTNYESDRQKVAKWLKAKNGGEQYLKNGLLSANADTSSLPIIVSKKVGFYGFRGEMKAVADLRFETIPAEIHDNQTVQNGSMVKIRLLKDLNVKGIMIPKNNFLSGICSLNGNRLLIQINTVGVDNKIIPIQISVYDLDYQVGISVPLSPSNDAQRAALQNATQTSLMGINAAGTTINNGYQSAGEQIVSNLGKGLTNAATVGLMTFASQKLGEVKIHLKAGQKVLLKINE
ncbi:MAG: conjugative transposon protein TraM [Arcicella sp.]|jgi:conjugative transposon TraM protein|nr:conjugative transposon protein TraM [Arcicella sp.]